MAKGIIYLMSTIVDGLIKIGKTTSDNYENRMYHLEHNGYCNVVGLKREFAIEVEEYDEKEKLLHEIFSKSCVSKTELFSVDINIVKQLLSSFDGKIIFPKEEDKNEIFEQATEAVDSSLIPNGEYYIKNKSSNATMIVKDGKITIKKGAKISSANSITVKGYKKFRDLMRVEDGVLQEDVVGCTSPSMAAAMVIGRNANGWEHWKTKDGEKIDIFRQKK